MALIAQRNRPIKGAGYRSIPALLRSLSQFDGNSCSARTVTRYTTSREFLREGVLPLVHRLQFTEAVKAASDEAPLYVVWSRDTPIAWRTAAGVVTIPDVKYSQTTSRQQNLCRAHL